MISGSFVIRCTNTHISFLSCFFRDSHYVSHMYSYNQFGSRLVKLTRDSTDDKTVLESRKWFASFLVVYEGLGGKPPEPLPEYDSKRLVSYWQITSNFARTYIRAMLTWRSHTSKSREKWPGICRECKSLWIICFLLNIVVVELVWGEEFEWPYICERQHTICRSDIELFKRDNVLPLTIYTVQCSALRHRTANNLNAKFSILVISCWCYCAF